MDGEERNHNDGAQALGDDALRGLQIHVGPLDVLGNHGRMLPKRKLYGRLARRDALRRKPLTAGAAREANFQHAVGVRFEEHPSIGIGDGDGMIEHGTENGVEGKLRVKQGSGFEEQVEFAEAAADGFGAGNVLDSGEEVGNRILATARAGAKDEFVGVFQAKCDGVPIVEGTAFDFFTVDEESAALAAIFDVQAARFEDDSGAIPGNPAVGQLKMIACLRTATDKERSLSDAHIAASAVGRDDLQNCAAHGYGSCVGHEVLATGL